MKHFLPFLLLLYWSSSALAHNFVADPGVDHWTEVRVLEDRVVITYSTYLQEGAVAADLQVMDLDKDGKVSPDEEEMFKAMMLSNLKGFLSLAVDGRPVELAASTEFHNLRARRYRFVGELSDLPRGEHHLAFYDGTFLALPGRLKTSLIAIGKAKVLEWKIPEDRPLPENPKDRALLILEGRKDVRTITLRYRIEGMEVAGGGTSRQKRGQETLVASTLGGGGIRDRLRDMINSPRWDLGALVATLLTSFAFGGAHALTPGHGKTIVAAYLVGTKGRVWDAILLGGIVTVTHTSSVFLLGLGMLFASQQVMPQKFIPWLTALSGALVAGMGIWLLIRRLSSASGHSHGHHSHHHGQAHGFHAHPPEHVHDLHDHGHEQEHKHSHSDEVLDQRAHEAEMLQPSSKASEVSLGSLLSLGISGGLVPCPEALIVLLIAIALNRITLGLAILLSFSIGLASVLVAIGILLVIAKPIMTRFAGEGKVVTRYLPVASAAVITLLGCGIAIKGLLEAGIR